MKNVISSIAFVFLLLLSIASVNAANVDINSSRLTNGQIYFTGDNNDQYDSSEILVNNKGILPLINNINSTLTLKFSGTELVHESDSESRINITNTPFSIAALAALDKELPKVNSIKDIEAGVYTGVLNVINDSNGIQFASVPVKVLVPALEVTSIEIRDAESDISDAKLEKGQRFTVTVNYENIAEETDVEDVNVRVRIFFGDDEELDEIVENIEGDELDEDTDVSDLKTGKTGSVKFEFEMPFDFDDKDEFTVFAEITASAEDTNSEFYARDTKEFEGSVADNRVDITRFTILPSTLACDVNRARVIAEVRNTGDSSEDVQLFIRNLATGFDHMLNGGEDIELDNDFKDEEDFTEQIEEFVTFTDLKAGQNTYTLVAYFNDGDSYVQKDIVITSQSCTATPAPDEDNSNGDVVVIPPTADFPTGPTSPISNPSYVTLKDVSGFGFDSDLILPIAIGIGGLIVGIIVALLVIPRP